MHTRWNSRNTALRSWSSVKIIGMISSPSLSTTSLVATIAKQHSACPLTASEGTTDGPSNTRRPGTTPITTKLTGECSAENFQRISCSKHNVVCVVSFEPHCFSKVCMHSSSKRLFCVCQAMLFLSHPLLQVPQVGLQVRAQVQVPQVGLQVRIPQVGLQVRVQVQVPQVWLQVQAHQVGLQVRVQVQVPQVGLQVRVQVQVLQVGLQVRVPQVGLQVHLLLRGQSTTPDLVAKPTSTGVFNYASYLKHSLLVATWNNKRFPWQPLFVCSVRLPLWQNFSRKENPGLDNAFFIRPTSETTKR